MATFRKRGNKWRVETCISGVRKSKTFDNKAACYKWALEQEESDSVTRLPHHTLIEAMQRYAREVSIKKKGEHWEVIRLNKFERELEFAEKSLHKIKPSDIAKWRDSSLCRVTPGTVIREMVMLRSVFEIARKEWGWIERNPMKDIRQPSPPPPRNRRISVTEKDALLKQLGYKEGHLPSTKKQITAYAWLIALETAMRTGELLSLNSSNMHLDKRYVTLVDTKNGDKRDVPLTKRAVELLKLLPDPPFEIDNAVLSSTFRRARIAAGITDMTFHDSRHEALTMLAQKIPVLDLARMVGHRDPRSLMVYYNPTAEEIAEKLG